jgi:hypothetical protein
MTHEYFIVEVIKIKLHLMADNIFHDLEDLWDALLSRDAQHIRAAYNSLAVEDQKAVLDHLINMVNEPGWHTEQRISARTALEALASHSKQV